MIFDKNSVSTLFIFMIAYEIQSISCPVNEANASSKKDKFAASTSGTANQPPPPSTNPLNEPAETFISIWNSLNLTVEQFSREYETLFGVSVLPDHDVNETALFEAGFSLIYGTLRLSFMYLEEDRQAQSSVIIYVPKLGEMHNGAVSMLFYEKEKYMYSEVLPAMYRSWQHERLSPHFYLSSDSGLLVVENLRELGFYTKEDTLVNLTECMQVFKSLARFHALSTFRSVAYVYKNLEAYTVTRPGKSVLQNRLFSTVVSKFRTLVLPHLQRELVTLFEEMVEDVDFGINAAYSRDEGINVILHGNLSQINVFLKNNKDNMVAECAFIDFHNSRPGAPVLDLISYLITSVRFDVFQVHRDALFNTYLEVFEQTLGTADVNNPNRYTIDELWRQLKKYKLFFAFELTSKVLLNRTRYAVFSSNVEEEDDYDRLLKSDKFISFYKHWMEVFLTW